LKEELKEKLEDIEKHEKIIAELIPQERSIKNQSQVKNGKRKLPPKLMEELGGSF
jgi:hypothetical protein